eukprot:6196122-Pleurochrysis_carterae.AAC.2
MEMRSRRTDGTQCLHRSAPWPSSSSTEPTGSGSDVGALNSPSLTIEISRPNKMCSSDSSESVQKGREKSWWSMCGGMQSPCETKNGERGRGTVPG